MSQMPEIQAVFFCAGARNQRLLEKLSEYPLYMEIDERIASFRALGVSKSKNKPSIICTTSGTAVSECLSVMIEAYYSEVPIILVSADRPQKLTGSGAPQTIDHEQITRGYRNDFKDITFEEFLLLDYSSLKFPAHINVRITTTDEITTPKTKEYSSFKAFINEIKRPLFIFSHEAQSMRSLILKFSSYHIPFYAEVGSGAKDLSSIKTEKKLLALLESQAFDGIVRIGHTPLSKLWRLLESRNLPVYSFDSRGLKALSHGIVEAISGQDLERSTDFWDVLPINDTDFRDESVNLLQLLCTKYPFSEVSLIKRIHDLIPEGAQVFLGNSLPIRYFELIQTKPFKIMVNRGVNGIDGQVATAQGWCLTNSDIVYCIIGDMTFSYDISSLLNFPKNLKCIVINNSGGRIFEVLKMDQHLVMEHDKSFKEICEGFKLNYQTNLDYLDQAQIIELRPDLNESRQFLKEWQL